MRFWLILTLLLSVTANASLKKSFEREVSQPTSEAEFFEFVRGKHIVFVGGYFTELYSSLYFAETKGYLSRFLPKAQLDIVFPDSRIGAEENAATLRTQLEDLYAQGGFKPLWVIGHSKGGQEAVQIALQTAVEKPALLSNPVIEKIVSIQGTVGGSPLGKLTVLDRTSAKAANDRWTERLSGATLAANRELVRRKLYFVRGSHWVKEQEQLVAGSSFANGYSNVLERDIMALVLKSSAWKMGFFCAANDGLVCLGDQILEGWGVDLTADAPLDNDHTDLAVSYPISNAGGEFAAAGSSAVSGRLYREAFIRALIRELSQN